jgi:hypothetical protein
LTGAEFETQEGGQLARPQDNDVRVDAPSLNGETPVQIMKPVPQKAPDWKVLRAEVTVQFSQTIAYLAK